MKNWQCLVMAAMFVMYPLEAQCVSEKEIDRRIAKMQNDCMDKDGSTMGMVACAEKAYAEWDKEMNKRYQLLLKNLPADGKAALKNSQQAWLKFRDAEFKNIDGIYNRLEGTMYAPMQVESRTRVVRDRTLQLLSLGNL